MSTSTLLRSGVLLSAFALSSCLGSTELTSFGRLCTSNDTCEAGVSMCRESPGETVRRCLPPRAAGEPGETCAAPSVAPPTSSSSVLLDREVVIGAARDDLELECASGVAAPDVVVRFTVPPLATGSDGEPVAIAGIRARVEGPGQFGLSLRRQTDDCLEAPALLRFGCAPAGEVLELASIEPGDYDLVVDGVAAGVGVDETPTRVIVERLACPPGALPFDEGRCIRTSPATALLTRRAEHTIVRRRDGSLVVLAGFDGTDATGTFEVLDPTLQRWRYGELPASRRAHSSVLLRDDRILNVGGIALNGDPDLVDVERLDVGSRHAEELQVVGFEDQVLTQGTEATVAAVAGDRVLVLRTGASSVSGVFVPDPRSRSCSNDLSCGPSEVCVVADGVGGEGRVCVCATGDCPQVDLRFREIFSLGDMAEDVAVAVMNERYAVLVGAGGDVGPLATIDTRLDTLTVEPVAGAVARAGAAVVAINAQQVAIIGGVDAGGAALATVEIFDLATRNVVVDDLLELPRTIARPRAAMLGGALVVLADGDSDEPIILDPVTGQARRSTLMQQRVGGAFVVDGDSIVVSGGYIGGAVSRSVERLELVAQTAAPARAPLRCDAQKLEPVSQTIRGNTRTADDMFSTAACGYSGFGRDNLFTFELTERSSVKVRNIVSTATGAHGVYLLRGECDDYDAVACGISDQDLALFAGDLPPATYTLVVEHQLFVSDRYGGDAWEALLDIRAPESCPRDSRDPADDVVAGATWLDVPAGLRADLTGSLCPGDVDHVLVESWGGPDNFVSLANLSTQNMTIRRAVLDSAATLAAGHPVAAAAGDVVANLDGEPAGHYLITLTAPADAVDFVQWELVVNARCVPDDDDFLVPALDDETFARARTLRPGESTTREFCTNSDRDLVILEPAPTGRASFVTISGDPEDRQLELFNIVAGALGSARPFTVLPDPAFSSSMRIELGVLPGPVALRLSLASSPAVAADSITVRLGQSVAGDSCADALALVVDDARSGVVEGDASAFNNDHNAGSLGDCTTYGSPGPEVVYRVRLESNETISLTALNSGEADDVSLYILGDCDNDEASCVAGIDLNGRGFADELEFTNDGPAQDFFVVLDSFYGSPFLWNLQWSITAP